MLLLSLQCLFLLLPLVLGGSHCPPREEIRPCICMSRPLGKRKLETTLICHNMADDNSIQNIDSALRVMEVDKFLLYDSFWRMAQKSVPMNVLSKYRIHELDVVDTTLKNFGCPMKDTCATTYLKKFSCTNSTLNENLLCSQGLNVHSWLSCTELLEYLEISEGMVSEWNLKPEFFPQPMTKLKHLHLTHDKIKRIERGTFTSAKFPALHTVDLSNNLLRDLKALFSTPMKIKHLDLSFNEIRSIPDFSFLPQLETLKLIQTQITTLLEYEWARVPTTMRHLDLTSNSLKCDCVNFKWVNSTFHINANLMGSCESPHEVKGMKLRKASRALIERCDEKNAIGSRIKKKKTP